MTRILTKYEFELNPRHYQGSPFPCPHYGGTCTGDGCRHWMPLPSAGGCQEANCDIERGGEPIHKAEARRKAIRYLIWAASAPDRVNQEKHLVKANNWMFASFSAPERSPTTIQEDAA